MSKPKSSKSTAPKPRRHPELLRKSATMTVHGRIHGTGKRLTDAEKEKARSLRKADPDTYTLRRLAAAFGIDPASMYYLLQGGRTVDKPKARKAVRRTVRTVGKAARRSTK